MPFRSLGFLLYFFGSSTAAFVYPMVGLVCYVVLYHLYPATTWWGRPLEPLGVRYAFICGACLLIGTFLNAGRLRFGRRFLHPIEFGIICFFLAMLLSLVTGLSTTSQTALLLDKMSKLVLFLLALSHVVTSKQRLWILTVVFVVMILYLGHEAKNAPPSAFTKNRLNGIGGPDFRESAGLAIHLCALMPFAAIVLRQKHWLLKLTAFLAVGYGTNAILLCRARSAFLGAIVAGLLALWYAPQRFRKWIAGMLLLGALGGFFLSDYWFWQRMDTIVANEEERDDSAAIRLQIWSAALEMIKANPLGVGVGQFPRHIRLYSDTLDKRRDAHNTYILCAGELGVVGLAAYLGTLVMAWCTLNETSRWVRSRLTDRDLFEWLILANRLGLVVFVVAGFFVSRLYTEGLWWLIVLPVCLSRAVENEIREETAAAHHLHEQLTEWSAGEGGTLPMLGRA